MLEIIDIDTNPSGNVEIPLATTARKISLSKKEKAINEMAMQIAKVIEDAAKGGDFVVNYDTGKKSYIYANALDALLIEKGYSVELYHNEDGTISLLINWQ